MPILSVLLHVAAAQLLLLGVPAAQAQVLPVTQEVRVSSSADDAEQIPGSYFSTTSSDLELAVEADVQTIGIRFNGLTIPQLATVSSAYIQFQVDEASSGPIALTIRAEAADSAASFSPTADVLSRTPTAMSVGWSPPDWPIVGARADAQRTIDLAAVIQEVVDRPGWGIGNSLVILITGSGTRVAESYDGDANGAPLLHLEYIISEQQAPSVDAGPDQTITLPDVASLDATVDDDGLPVPPGSVSVIWTQLSGPGVASFTDPATIDTVASFTLPGSYLLELSANDGERASSDTVTVEVEAAAAVPVVSAFGPTAAQVASVISITGTHLSDTRAVAFNGVPAPFWVQADDLIHATVPAGLAGGLITVTNATGEGSSADEFVLLPSPAVLVGAGDISECFGNADATANLLDAIAGTVFTAGDHAYDNGTTAEFNTCDAPTWGRHKARTRPAPGEVEYDVPGAADYFGYFGPAAGEPGKGYYSYDVGDWHIVALNSQCAQVGGCGAESPQGRWLREDLLRHPKTCTMAYWASPRFSSSSTHGSDASFSDFWQLLYDAGAELVVSGHDHTYERFAPQRADGTADPLGVRQFIAGTGGRTLYPITAPLPNSEIYNTSAHGVLKLTLNPASYDWEFVPIAGQTFTDSGSAACHAADQVPLV
ncbi:MAG: hypothetical protein P8Y76_13515 [bacterium]